MSMAIWALVVGVLLISMALAGTLLKRLPISTPMLYLLFGCALGPAGWALMSPNPIADSTLLEHLSEIALLISLFAAGLKLGVPLADRRWLLPVRLASASMFMTVVAVAGAAMLIFGFSWGAALVLAGVLAPTDPVLASDVQVENPEDRDRLRFSLTGEGAINDGAAFPVVMLGLGLLNLHELGDNGLRWIVVDLLWGTLGGLLIGGVLGTVIGKLVVYLRSQHQESVGLDEFLALGLVALSYGASVLLHAYGFLAVFAAGLALRRVRERREPRETANADARAVPAEVLATHPERASAFMMQAIKGFNEQLERVGEVAIVLVVGAMLTWANFSLVNIGFALLLFVLIRPASVWFGLLGADVLKEQKWLIGWLGIRGIGSVYYLMYAITHGLDDALARQMSEIVLTVVALSVVLHGISVTPLMGLYANSRRSRAPEQPH